MQLNGSNPTVTGEASAPLASHSSHSQARKKRLLDTLIRGARQQISSNEKQRCPK
jgi:hypothetical protein